MEVSEDIGRFKKRLVRTKTIQSQTEDADAAHGDGGLNRVLTTLDLISLGVGSCCGTGVYIVAGLVARNVAGPAVLFSFIIAAFASILSGKC
ncbi:DgyrCDS13169 [Dimorphilus gyrociliatus]|uniref:DgyrCDS13169 n=1 Tax=Dimorphilus gyrociliatus TaxID=2664684 RepID=A0A7I8W9W3_9ANNE|nr:DgyrCDS13169 [Dimorphilus gyrociliatus]